jgi:two-component system, NarL family, response regulator
MIRIMIADDHPVMREGLITILSAEEDMHVVAEAEDGEQAIELYRTYRPDIVLMDLRMPLIDGIEAMKAIRKEFSEGRFIILSGYDGDDELNRTLQAGAHGYLSKKRLPGKLLEAVRTVYAGKSYINQ